MFSGNGTGAIVMKGNSYDPILLIGEASQGFGLNYWQVTQGGWSGYGNWVSFALVDNLTTDRGYEALSAKQGKILNDKITPDSGSGAPTTATVGIVGKIYVDTDTDTAYMCTKVSGGEYTWKQITA